MSGDLLHTKLFVPQRPVNRQRPSLVPRPHLTEKLSRGLRPSHKLTLISAPAGFGKTTLVSEWISHLQLATVSSIVNHITWLSLDENDNEPTRFLIYFVTALSQIEGEEAIIGEDTLSLLQLPKPPPTKAILTSILNEIAALPHRISLVLDDYHLIEAQPVHDALTFLLEHLPQQMHLIIATRDDPPLPLARLRARGQLMELRAADLRFSSAEAAEFLNKVMGLNLSRADIAALESRTEGWIAGLQLAAISLQGSHDPTSQIKSFSGSHRFVMDYLIEEVLEQQPATMQRFLLQTAVLNRLTGSLCNALTGQDNGQETLEMLEHANLFIVPLDEERRWYRYHHLFADLLRRRLRQTYREQIPSLYSQASEWYEQNGFADEAIKYALRAEAFERAANLIEKVAETAWVRGEDTKLRSWLDGLPAETVSAKPQLCIFHAWSLLATGQQDAAGARLQAAEQALGFSTAPNSPDKMKLQGRVATARAFMAFYQGNVAEMIQFSHQALNCLPKQDVSWRGIATNILADAYDFQGEAEAAYPARLEAVEASKAAGNCYQIIIANLKLALTLRARGQLPQVVEICQQQMQLANECGTCPAIMVGWLLAVWGEALAEMNDLDGAVQQVNKGIALTEQGGDLAMLGWSYLCLVRVLFTQGDFAAAEAAIQKMAHIDRDNDMPPWITSLLTAWQVRLWLAQGELDTAVRWMEERGLDAAADTSYALEREYVVLVRIFIVQGRLNEASSLLQRLLAAAKAGGRTARVIEILLLQALAYQAESNTARAIIALEQALTLAEPGGFIRIFVDEGQPMATLLSKALVQDITPNYVKKLLAAFSTSATKAVHESTIQNVAKRDPAERQSEIVEPLSERELEVLQRLAEGLTNREIADRLYLSLNTVKVHTRNIYGKLGVHNRTQAAAKARELGLLPPM